MTTTPPPPDDTVEVTVRLRRDRTNDRRWETLLAAATVPDLGGRRFLDAHRIAAADAARPEDLDRVLGFAREHGLEVAAGRNHPSVCTRAGHAGDGDAGRNAREVVLRGRHDAVERAFATPLVHVDVGGVVRHGHDGEVAVPATLQGAVDGVLLRDTPRARTYYRLAGPDATGGRTARQLADFYNALDASGAALRADGTTVAIISFGGGYDLQNIISTCQKMGVPVPQIDVVSVDGAQPAYTGDSTGPDVENHLDISAIAGAAPGCRIKFFIAPNTSQGMVDAINAVAADSSVAVASMSWGDKWANYTAAERQAISDAVQRMSVAGIPLLNSAGDNGDREKGTSPTPDFPTSDAHVTSAVGVDEPGTHADTTVWNDLASGGGVTGAGDSPDQNKPAQQSVIQDGDTHREYGDIAAIAAPAHGCTFDFAGQSITVGGTSLSAPLLAGFFAVLTAANGGKRLGELGPLLYQWIGTNCVWDVTRGGTEDYTAGSGYDRPTGVGTMNVANARTWVQQRTAAPPALS